jgi:hypothetical protein
MPRNLQKKSRLSPEIEFLIVYATAGLRIARCETFLWTENQSDEQDQWIRLCGVRLVGLLGRRGG